MHRDGTELQCGGRVRLTDDAPTPNVSGSFAVLHDAAHELAGRLDTVVAEGRLGMFESSRAARLAVELHTLAHRFAAWPHKSDAQVSLERDPLTRRLGKIRSLANDLLKETPCIPTPKRS